MGVCLSVLIPAYGYAEGVMKILSSFRDDPPDEIEILIFDDSRDEQVSQLVSDFCRYYLGKLHYRRNRPGLGAVANWNSLLEQASGEYILLLHHDEYPLGKRFARRAIDLLNSAPEADVFVMECILRSSKGAERTHLPRVIQKLVLKYLPAYLFKRNIIGPTSCVIARRTLYPRFDEGLRWLVDVEAYYRLRQATVRWRVSGDLKIGSTLGRKDSITASIKDKLKDLNTQERTYLSLKHPAAIRWLAPRQHWILNTLESITWVTMRATTRLYYQFIYFFSTASISTSIFQRASKNDHR